MLPTYGGRARRSRVLRGASASERRRDELLVYELTTLRFIGQESMLWQTPALAITAQAFLLTVALGSDTARTARCISAFLALVTALISAQLMMKHRFVGQLDTAELRRIENELGLPAVSIRRKGEPGTPQAGWLLGRSSYRLWLSALCLFGLAALLILLLAVARPGALSA